MQTLASILIALATALLKTFLEQRQARLAIEDRVHLQVQINTLEQVKYALEWKARAVRNPHGGADLRVREPDAHLADVPCRDPDLADPPGVQAVRDPAAGDDPVGRD